MYNFIRRNSTEALPQLLMALDTNGEEVGSRNGRVKELLHVNIELTHPWERELMVPGRKPHLPAQIAETMWVLAGRNDLEFLSHYLPRAADFSDDGKTWRAGYGPRLRKWEGDAFNDETDVDQFAECYRLLKADPTTRRAVMSIFDPGVDYADSKDIPCNNWLSWSSRLGKLNLHVAIRSNDVMWGWSGINAFEWSAMQEIMAGLLGLQVGSLVFSTTSLHLYDRHWEKASKIVDSNAEDLVMPLRNPIRFQPRLPEGMGEVLYLDMLIAEWFQAEESIRKGHGARLARIEKFPEPMLRSWLEILDWWWNGRAGAAQYDGVRYSIQPKREPKIISPVVAQRPPSPFIQAVIALHDEKHRAYGDSWKRRGEMLGILANIARKIDRLGGAETSDETSADTAIDLLVYLAKYRSWLEERITSSGNPITDDTKWANDYLLGLDRSLNPGEVRDRQLMERLLKEGFEKLEPLAKSADPRRYGESIDQVAWLASHAYKLAAQLWTEPDRNATRHWNPEQ